MYVGEAVCKYRFLWRPEALYQELQLQVLLTHLLWVLGNKLNSSAKVVRAANH